MQLKLAQTHLLLGEIHMEQGTVISIVRYYDRLATWEERYVPVVLHCVMTRLNVVQPREGKGGVKGVRILCVLHEMGVVNVPHRMGNKQ